MKKEAHKDEPATPAAPEGRGQQTRIVWDDTGMRSTYANVCNVSSTREEVTLLFGTNQTWHSGNRQLTVQLTDRMILSPFAAKRLALLLTGLVKEYENRFGNLRIEGTEDAN